MTEVLKVVGSDGLQKWAIDQAMQKLQKLLSVGLPMKAAVAEAKLASEVIKETAGRRGTATHKLIEGKKIEDLDLLVDDARNVKVMHESFLLWAKDRNFEAFANEVPVWSDIHGFRGTLDCIGGVDGSLELIDWKTSNSISSNYRMQVAAYLYGLRESAQDTLGNVPDVQRVRIVRFGGRSDPKTQEKDVVRYDELVITLDEAVEDYSAFLAAKSLHDFNLRHPYKWTR